jgi:hypothetical protein
VEPASNVYEAAIVAVDKPHGRRRKISISSLDDVVGGGQPGRLELVVRRKDDGEVIVRTPADLGSPDAMLTTVQNDLNSMSAEEFFEEWKMPVV